MLSSQGAKGIMANYEVLWVSGDYDERQKQANEAHAVAYVEHHLNALARDQAGVSDNPALSLIAHNGSATSERWGSDYSARAANLLGTVDSGCRRVGYRSRGDYNLRLTNMPAILVEPLFVSEPRQAEFALSDAGQDKLASILVASIQKMFPDGGKVAFSVGHLGKTDNPHDRGAPVVRAWRSVLDPESGEKRREAVYHDPMVWEADLCEKIMRKAAAKLVKYDPIESVGCKCPYCGKALQVTAR